MIVCKHCVYNLLHLLQVVKEMYESRVKGSETTACPLSSVSDASVQIQFLSAWF